jgi:hypothetical protein
MQRCRLTRIQGGTSLRTDFVEGVCEHGPEVGQQFKMAASPLTTAGDMRLVHTSSITTIEKISEETFHCFTASGSLYRVELLPPDEHTVA